MYIIGKTANEQNLDKLCSRGTDVPKLYFYIKNVHFSKPNVEYKKKKKDNSDHCYQYNPSYCTTGP